MHRLLGVAGVNSAQVVGLVNVQRFQELGFAVVQLRPDAVEGAADARAASGRGALDVLAPPNEPVGDDSEFVLQRHRLVKQQASPRTEFLVRLADAHDVVVIMLAVLLHDALRADAAALASGAEVRGLLLGVVGTTGDVEQAARLQLRRHQLPLRPGGGQDAAADAPAGVGATSADVEGLAAVEAPGARQTGRRCGGGHRLHWRVARHRPHGAARLQPAAGNLEGRGRRRTLPYVARRRVPIGAGHVPVLVTIAHVEGADVGYHLLRLRRLRHQGRRRVLADLCPLPADGASDHPALQRGRAPQRGARAREAEVVAARQHQRVDENCVALCASRRRRLAAQRIARGNPQRLRHRADGTAG
mmetsp:Transcript_38579/g.110840  ORF Transcript_38579/g.110840 Transcript_38579/m.110840 type:complete len:360 (+) Transcript_38579:602-1681(+)